jgi:hypothetical protein
MVTIIIRRRVFDLAVMDTQQGKNIHKGGEIVRDEPYDLQLFNSDPFFREAF